MTRRDSDVITLFVAVVHKRRRIFSPRRTLMLAKPPPRMEIKFSACSGDKDNSSSDVYFHSRSNPSVNYMEGWIVTFRPFPLLPSSNDEIKIGISLHVGMQPSAIGMIRIGFYTDDENNLLHRSDLL